MASAVSETGSALQSERDWCLKRDWTDLDFQGGKESNGAQLAELERQLLGLLGAVPALPGVDSDDGDDLLVGLATADPASRDAILNHPQVLGSALDLVGAYLKNYEVDRANAIVETVLPLCRKRGGLWLLKALNHYSTVRMKQSRPLEALQALREIEVFGEAALADPGEAWEFWETVFRNYAWVLSSLERGAEAISFVERAIAVKARVGKDASWFDLWDLGRLRAVAALKGAERPAIVQAREGILRALWLHRDEEPQDLVMRAKIWHSAGECSFALAHLEESADVEAPVRSQAAKAHLKKALTCFKEAHKLFRKTEGAHNPLTGGEAEAVAWTLLRMSKAEEAKGFLLDALEACAMQQNAWGDGLGSSPALLRANSTVERILAAHRSTDDRSGLKKFWPAVEKLVANVLGRICISKTRRDAPVYERLISNCSMIFVATGTDEGVHKSQELMQKCMWESPDTFQAKLCSQILRGVTDRVDESALLMPATFMHSAAALNHS